MQCFTIFLYVNLHKAVVMIKKGRLDTIVELVTKNRTVSHSELSEILNVHEDTIRRDIKILSDKGLLSAVRGGAVSHAPIPHQFRDREKHIMEQKKIAASKAVELLQDGQVVFMDAGSSVQILAELIPLERRLTVITHSFPVVSVLENHPNIEILFAAGRFDKQTCAVMGHETIQFFKNFRADICFNGICSINTDLGLTTVSREEAAVKRTMMEMAKQNVALSTLDKLHTAEAYFICPVNSLNAIITDADPDHKMLDVFKQCGIAVY